MTAQLTYLNASEVAEILHLTTGTLARWRCKGIGPRWRKVGARVLYNQQDLIDYLENK